VLEERRARRSRASVPRQAPAALSLNRTIARTALERRRFVGHDERMARAEAHRKRKRRRPLLWLLRTIVVLMYAPVLALVAIILVMRWMPPPTTAFMLHWRFDHGMGATQLWVPWEEISLQAALAVVAAEDQKFPFHDGFDMEAIEEALAEAREGGRSRGASTISQQVAKNLFLWPSRSWARKGVEAALTVLIEKLWPKRRILEVYLNIAEFGEGNFGVEAAARAYFNQRATRLDAAQAALLAAVLPAPNTYSVRRPSDYVRRRQAWIMRQMNRLGMGYVAALER
jgi:monofunctional biosynthetic peptidoglycan transglycosylase